MRRKLERKIVLLFLVFLSLSISGLLVSMVHHSADLYFNNNSDEPYISIEQPRYNVNATASQRIRSDINVLGINTMEKDLNVSALQDHIYNYFRRHLRSNVDKELKYYNLSRPRTDHCDIEFLINGANICAGLTPFLVILIPSAPEKSKERQAIRETWGKYATGLQIPPPYNSTVVTLAFLLGNVNASNNHVQIYESERFQDIVHGDFLDTYENLTRKSLMGLKWVTTYCSEAEYIFKVDDDVFVHIPRLVELLKKSPADQTGAIYGRLLMRSSVQRTGRWALSVKDYPMRFLPPYMSGSRYVISSNIARKLLAVSMYFPYLPIEDVFITGVLRIVIGARSVIVKGFTLEAEDGWAPCEFIKENRISETVKNVSLMKTMWSTQQSYLRLCVNIG